MSETSAAPTGTPNLNKALSLLQGEMPKVTKTKTGKVEGENKAGKYFSYEYSYADLGDVVADMGPLMAKHGLAFLCAPMIDPASRGQMILVWSLLHESGEERSGEWPLGPVNQKPQSLGSAITYGRRYSFTAATNIVLEDDDDGQRAQQDHGSRQTAADAFENAAPAAARQSGRPQPPPPSPEATDADAQVFADKAHNAQTHAEIETIHRDAREANKVTALIRNPASGGVGKLAVYLDWKRKQLVTAKPAGLDPDDPWAAKVEELGSEDDAFAAISELADLLNDEKIDGERFKVVQAAIEARFPQVNAEGRAA